MRIGKPRDFTNDKIVFRKGINGNGLHFARCDIEQVEANSRVLGADLGVAQLQLASIDRGNIRIVHIVGNAECANAGLVEA